mmetsp:Transcript_24317/g.60007  ORF Transcript_24317/g.60007 Transcript_24317/m.60007 type:complete len:268 (-) Transcript_24317:81-884(-)
MTGTRRVETQLQVGVAVAVVSIGDKGVRVEDLDLEPRLSVVAAVVAELVRCVLDEAIQLRRLLLLLDLDAARPELPELSARGVVRSEEEVLARRTQQTLHHRHTDVAGVDGASGKRQAAPTRHTRPGLAESVEVGDAELLHHLLPTTDVLFVVLGGELALEDVLAADAAERPGLSVPVEVDAQVADEEVTPGDLPLLDAGRRELPDVLKDLIDEEAVALYSLVERFLSLAEEVGAVLLRLQPERQTSHHLTHSTTAPHVTSSGRSDG